MVQDIAHHNEIERLRVRAREIRDRLIQKVYAARVARKQSPHARRDVDAKHLGVGIPLGEALREQPLAAADFQYSPRRRRHAQPLGQSIEVDKHGAIGVR
jgi:hypothetical protein